MRRILFVDDEPSVLDGLRRSLRKQRKSWEMEFVESGAAALAMLAERPFDVIVSDMRMPGMDGAVLLKRVQHEHPSVVRLVLSGFSELEASMRAAAVAHQFISKPCEVDVLQAVVERACGLNELLENEDLRSLVNEMSSLPSLPSTYAALTRVLAVPEAGFREVAEVISGDAAICAKVLQLVNSSFFGLPQRVNDMETAISLLGTNMVKNLVMSAEVFSPLGNDTQLRGFDFEEERVRTLFTAQLARAIATSRLSKRDAEDAYMAGVLHDVGRLVLASQLPKRFQKTLDAELEGSEPSWQRERMEFGVTHADVGAYLLGVWGLPYPIVEAVAMHHEPERIGVRDFDVTVALYVANALLREHRDAGIFSTQHAEQAPDLALLEKIGVADSLDEWRALVPELEFNQETEAGREMEECDAVIG